MVILQSTKNVSVLQVRFFNKNLKTKNVTVFTFSHLILFEIHIFIMMKTEFGEEQIHDVFTCHCVFVLTLTRTVRVRRLILNGVLHTAYLLLPHLCRPKQSTIRAFVVSFFFSFLVVKLHFIFTQCVIASCVLASAIVTFAKGICKSFKLAESLKIR